MSGHQLGQTAPASSGGFRGQHQTASTKETRTEKRLAKHCPNPWPSTAQIPNPFAIVSKAIQFGVVFCCSSCPKHYGSEYQEPLTGMSGEDIQGRLPGRISASGGTGEGEMERKQPQSEDVRAQGLRVKGLWVKGLWCPGPEC